MEGGCAIQYIQWRKNTAFRIRVCVCVYARAPVLWGLLFWLSKKLSNVIEMFIVGHTLSENTVADGSRFRRIHCWWLGDGRTLNLPTWAFLPSLALNLGLTTSHFLGLTHEVFAVDVNFHLELTTDSREVVPTSAHIPIFRQPPMVTSYPCVGHYQNHYVDMASGNLLDLRHDLDLTTVWMHFFSLSVISLCIILWHFITCTNSYNLHHIQDTENFHHH